jgi:hypothetical protein
MKGNPKSLPNTTTGSAYVMPIWKDGARYTVMVWNGIKNYERVPSPESLGTVNMGGLTFGKTVTIAQISKPMDGKERSALRTINLLLERFDSVILWARDTKVYDSIRDELRMTATRRFDGTPLTEH